MVDIGITIEGQDGLTWPRWKRIATRVEDLGFESLFRSDHFVNPDGPHLESLDLWVSLSWLAANTMHINFGSLVTPMSFRHPVHTARMAKDLDKLSDGRMELGVGAGWQEREHEMFGFDLLDIRSRFDRFEEGVEVINQLLESSDPVSYDGEYYQLNEAMLGPSTSNTHNVDPIIGGNGESRTLPLAAEYASEWNGVHLSPAEFAELNDSLDDCLAKCNRPLDEVRRSVMTHVLCGRDENELNDLLDGRSKEKLRAEGWIIGTPTEVSERIADYEKAGADRIMLQWLEYEDLDRLEAMADSVL